MKPRHTPSPVTRIALFTLLIAALTAVPGWGRGFAPESFRTTLVVSPVGTPQENGQSLLATVQETNTNQDDRALIWIEPGVYDLGDSPLILKPYLSVQGSGSEVTVLQGNAQPEGSFDIVKGLVHGADHSSLKDLTLTCRSDEAQGLGACLHMVNFGTSPHVADVEIQAEGYGSFWGIRNVNGSPKVANVGIEVRGTINNYGIVNSLQSYPEIRRAEITAAEGAYLNAGVFNRDGAMPLVIDDTEIFVAGGSQAFAVYNYNSSQAGDLEIIDSLLVARDSQDAGAVRDGSVHLTAHGSTFRAEGTGSALQLGHAGSIDVRDSELQGSRVLAFAGEVRLGSVRLQGGGSISATGASSCAAVFSLDNGAQFFENTCPTGSGTGTVTTKKLRLHPLSERAHR